MGETHPILNHEAGQPISAQAFSAAMAQYAPNKITKVAVAVSGGADSMALVLLADAWAKASKVGLTALIVDHRLRAQSTAEAQAVARWLEGRGIAHAVLTWREGDAVRQLHRSAQDAAREARLSLLTHWCRANQIPALLLAHHADDQIETFYMRLARGSGLSGLGGMQSVTMANTIAIHRPLLGFSKADLVSTCRSLDQDWIEDPSNQSTKYTRTRFRQARALMEGEGFTRERVLSTIAHLQRAKAALGQFIDNVRDETCIWTSFGTVTISAPKLLAAPEEVSLRLLSDLLRVIGGQTYGPRFDALRRLYAKLQESEVKAVTLHGCCIGRMGDSINIHREPSAVHERADLSHDLPIVWDGRFEIAWVRRDMAMPNLRIRPYRSEDKSWWKNHGSIGALADIPARVRRALPVIEDDSGLLAMPHARLWRRDSAEMSEFVTIRCLVRERLETGIPADFQAE
jgi:tRNA(Ile)-lysidine synthase